MDIEIDSYLVEHNENYEMTQEQLSKLIWEKFNRNNELQRLVSKRERQASELV
jgi:hypothetical protein